MSTPSHVARVRRYLWAVAVAGVCFSAAAAPPSLRSGSRGAMPQEHRAGELGFDPDHLWVVNLEFADATSIPEQVAAHEAAVSATAGVGGVERVIPLVTLAFGPRVALPIAIPDRPGNPWEGQQLPILNTVHPDYLDMLAIPLLRGRRLSPDDDRPGAARVAVIERRMAEFLWPDERALGKCFHVINRPPPGSGARMRQSAPDGGEGDRDDSDDPPPCFEVVGIVGNSMRNADDAAFRIMQYYIPFATFPLPPGFDRLPYWGLLVRTSPSTPAELADMRAAVIESSSSVTGASIRPFSGLIEG